MCAQNLIFLSLSCLKMRGSQAGTDSDYINKYISSAGILSRGIIVTVKLISPLKSKVLSNQLKPLCLVRWEP